MGQVCGKEASTMSEGFEQLKKEMEQSNGNIMRAIERLTTDVGQLKSDVGQLKSDVGQLNKKLLASDGEVVAGDITLRLFVEDILYGHGCLLRPRSDDNTYYLLTAAHILADIAAIKNLKAKFTNGNSVSLKQKNLYIPPNYVLNGQEDFGLLQVEVEVKGEGKLQVYNDLHMFGEPEVGSTVVAKGKVFLRGPVTSMENGRFSVVGHSVPGSSGAPLFNDEKTLVGLIHGDSKHRGKHGTNGRDETAIVYSDSIKFNNLRKVHPEKLEWLQWGEDVPLDLAKSPDNPHALREHLVEFPKGDLAVLCKEMGFNDGSLRQLFAKLDSCLWQNDSHDQNNLPDEFILVFLSI